MLQKKEPIILALETSSPVMSVALKKGNRILEKRVSGFQKHAEYLLPSIEGLLKKQKVSIQKIKTFLIGRGPGSFTGLRIGFSTLKGFLALRKCSSYGALSVDLIAENAKADLPPKARLGVLMDAYRQKIYCRFYRFDSFSLKPEGPVEVISLDELVCRLETGTFLAGDALSRYAEAFGELSKTKGLHLLEEKTWYPKASSLIALFENKDKKVQNFSKPSDFIPLYFRLSEAEERKNNYARTC